MFLTYHVYLESHTTKYIPIAIGIKNKANGFILFCTEGFEHVMCIIVLDHFNDVFCICIFF